MSRTGRRPIQIPDSVTVTVNPASVVVDGPKGKLEQAISPEIEIGQADGVITVTRPTDRSEHRSLHGLTRTLIANMVTGVTEGFQKRLELEGVGYRAQLKADKLELSVGFSHPVTIEAPEGINFDVPQPTEIVVGGVDKQRVGQVAADIRKYRPPEPYKGKGIRYSGEQILRKVGKRA